jgi:hypothetical protein
MSVKNFGIITESEWIGLSIKDAIEKARVDGFTHRIVEENGVGYMVTHDLKADRINFRVNNDTVTAAYGG